MNHRIVQDLCTGTLRQRGAALVVVLMALALLFSLGVPFLFASRLRSEASTETYSRALARVAVDSASRNTAFHQALSHPGIDPTPLWDSADEWDGTALGPMPQSMGADWARSRESWGAEVESTQTRVSLGTAPVMLLQNLIHPCFLTRDVSYREPEIPVTSTAGFPEEGLVLIGTRWVQYGKKTPNSFTNLVPTGDEPKDLDELRFREGYLVQDPRVQALVLANFSAEGHTSPEFLGDPFGFDFGLGPEALLPETDLAILEDLCTLRSGAYGTEEWEPATWTTAKIDPEEPDIISIDEDSYFSMGTVVRLLPDFGAPLDRLVLASGGGRLALSAPVPIFLDPLSTRVYPKRREPVDVNGCRPEILEALATGVAFRGAPPVATETPPSGRRSREWVNPGEARAFASRVVQARPLTGPQDLWDRVLAPMAEEGALTDVDAWALYLNSLDPNNGALRQSTTSFGYRSGNQYIQRINAAVRSRLGRTLARSSFRQTVSAAPSGPLLSILQDQESFEDFGRWSRGLHGVTTLPTAMGSLTSPLDISVNGPTLQLGTWPETGRMMPERDPETSAVIPMPARETDTYPFNGRGRTEHFDYDPSPLGRYLPETGPYSPPLGSWGVAGDSGLSDVEPLCLQGWFYGEDLQAGTMFELSGFENDRNRISAAMEQGQLVVRCQGTTGPDGFDLDGLEEEIIVRFDPAEYPIADRWFHLSVLIRDFSPRGLQVMLDGVPRGDIDGFTHLTQALASYAPGDAGVTIAVESTEGFPSKGALRIGDEVLEYTTKTETTFTVERDASTYFGGRSTREANDLFAITLDTIHPVGAAVEIYGYSAILIDDIPPGGKTLSGEVGPWSFADAINGPDDIVGEFPGLGLTIPLGTGFGADYVGAIDLGPLLIAPEDTYYAEAFQSDGGYALMWSAPLNVVNADDGSPVGGIEVIKYSSREGETLILAERNVQLPGLAEAPVDDPTDISLSSTGVTFITEYVDGFTVQGTDFNELEALQVYIVPISLHADGATEISYRGPDDDFSEFVQLGLPGDPTSVEWVRYDHIVDGHFVRDDWGALRNEFLVEFFLNLEDEEIEPPGPAPGPEFGGGLSLDWMQQEEEDIYRFRPTIGEPVDDRAAIINEVLWDFQFRGVMGTYDHAHGPGEEFTPVITTQRTGFTAANTDPGYGYVGRFDRVALMQAGEAGLPFWFEVNWSKVPRPRDRVRADVTYLAFTTSTNIPFTGHLADDTVTALQGGDRREFSRLCKYPNHERPRNFGNLVVGGTVAGGTQSLTGYVDEVSLVAVGGHGDPSLPTSRGAFILDQDLESGESDIIHIDPFDIILDGYRVSIGGGAAGQWIDVLPTSGLLDIDGELVAYTDIDTTTGDFTIAVDGRGMLGTEVRGHSSGTTVRLLDSRASAALDSDLDPSSESIQVANQAGFSRSGLLLIDQELMHAPMRGGGGFLSMPRERRDANGALGSGILRGRFGTAPANHSSGALVYSFPNRWMDNYSPGSDSGTGSWLQLGYEEPDALWRGLRYEAEIPDNSLSVRVLAKTGNAGWEDDPRTTPGLTLFEKGEPVSGVFQELGFRHDRLDLRVLFDWGVGAFDPVTFEATGWTAVPRLRSLVVDYLADSRVERDQEVTE
ncbi:MAG: hypothetical protein ACYTEP_10330 [Planctomycetota bacterium]|jgi:hypothetical protein